MLDDQELLATRMLNGVATWEDVQKFIDKNYVKRSELKEAIKYHEYARDLAGEQLTTTQIIADSDSLNYGRIEAHNVAVSKLEKILEKKE